MLKLSVDTTNSINICQEEIYHPTTASSKVSNLLRGRHWVWLKTSARIHLSLFTCFLCWFFTLKFFLITSTSVTISHTSRACVPCVFILFHGVPTLKHTDGASVEVFFNLVGMMVENERFYLFLSWSCWSCCQVLSDCCVITKSSIANIWIQIWRLWFTEPCHYQMLLFPPSSRQRRTITFSVFLLLLLWKSQHGTYEEILLLLKSPASLHRETAWPCKPWVILRTHCVRIEGKKSEKRGTNRGMGGWEEGARACQTFQTQRKTSTCAEVQLLAPVHRFITPQRGRVETEHWKERGAVWVCRKERQ